MGCRGARIKEDFPEDKRDSDAGEMSNCAFMILWVILRIWVFIVRVLESH